MTKPIKIVSSSKNQNYINIRLYVTDKKFEEYTIKNDTASEMSKELILKIRESNQKLLQLKKTVPFCRDLEVTDPLQIPHEKLTEFFAKAKESNDRVEVAL